MFFECSECHKILRGHKADKCNSCRTDEKQRTSLWKQTPSVCNKIVRKRRDTDTCNSSDILSQYFDNVNCNQVSSKLSKAAVRSLS